MNYPSLLRPTTTEPLMVGTQRLLVPKVELQLRPWRGAPIADTFGGKPLLNFGGRPVFAELAVVELLRLSGWEARWIEPYGAPVRAPRHYADWSPTLPGTARSQQPQHPITDARLLARLHALAAANGDTFAGCWNVLGWHGETLLFAECKRLGKDRLRDTQPRWLAAGLRVGLPLTSFLLVEWDFLG